MPAATAGHATSPSQSSIVCHVSFHFRADDASRFVAELGADADAFMLHLFAALAEKERAVIPQRMA